ncbi:MAG TPA: VWA domain-containing protein [Acidobacteriaceae bacterium]|jgi:VWFA-related protein
MRLYNQFCSLLLALLVLPAAALSAQAPPSDAPLMTIHVTVDDHSGHPVAGLAKDDFTLLDNKKPQSIAELRPVTGEQTKVIIVLDAVNLPYTVVSFARQQLDQFFSANDGRLPQPTTLAVVQDTGTQIRPDFTTDGNELRTSLDHFSIGLRDLRRSSGFYGADERMQVSLRAFDALMGQRTFTGPTRIIWVSPGWPLLSGPAVELSKSQANLIFNDVVALTTQLRALHVVVDAVNPVGAGQDVAQTYYFESFLHAPRSAHDAEIGDLGLQVIAVQSGGQVLNGSNDIAGLLRRALEQTKDAYQLSFTPAPGDRTNEYHELQLKVRRPGLTVHTSGGYYARPSVPSLPPATAASSAH